MVHTFRVRDWGMICAPDYRSLVSDAIEVQLRMTHQGSWVQSIIWLSWPDRRTGLKTVRVVQVVQWCCHDVKKLRVYMPCLLLHNCNACPAFHPQNITVDAHCHGDVQADALQTLYFVRSMMYTEWTAWMKRTYRWTALSATVTMSPQKEESGSPKPQLSSLKLSKQTAHNVSQTIELPWWPWRWACAARQRVAVTYTTCSCTCSRPLAAQTRAQHLHHRAVVLCVQHGTLCKDECGANERDTHTCVPHEHTIRWKQVCTGERFDRIAVWGAQNASSCTVHQRGYACLARVRTYQLNCLARFPETL